MKNQQQTLASHEYADIFPMAGKEDYARLVSDISENGLIEPIWLLDRKILDGRNRYKACIEAGVTPEFRDYQGDDALTFVLSLNLSRRHLNSSQCAFVAAKIKPMIAARAKERQLRTEENREKADNLVPQNFGEQDSNKHKSESNTEAAKTVGNTNAEYVRQAEKIEKEAPEVAEQVMAGNLNMPDAAKVAKLSKEKREKVVERVRQGEKAGDAIKKETGVHVGNNSGNNEWYTPPDFIETARAVMGSIDLDPASSGVANKTVKADNFFTADQDGLNQKWFGNVWLNPPYAQPLMGQFAEKVSSDFVSGAINGAIVLVNNATETAWFSSLASSASAVFFPKGRIRYLAPDGERKDSPLQGQAIVLFTGDNDVLDSFFELFEKNHGGVGMAIWDNYQ